jgi:hypothetical protein
MGRSGVGVVFASVALLAVGADVAVASLKPLPLSARVLGRGEFRGFTPGTRASSKTPTAYVAGNPSLTSGQRRSQIRRLTREGFKKELTEFLNNAQGPKFGLSSAMQFGSAAAARAERDAEIHFLKAQGQVSESFRVQAVPGAIGFGDTRGSSGGENILFADGPFVYLAGNSWSGLAHNPRRAALIRAATTLYERVHGHPAG